MRWTCDDARVRYEDIQARIALLAVKIRRADTEAIQLQLEATRLIGTHTLPVPGQWGR